MRERELAQSRGRFTGLTPGAEGWGDGVTRAPGGCLLPRRLWPGEQGVLLHQVPHPIPWGQASLRACCSPEQPAGAAGAWLLCGVGSCGPRQEA